MPDRYRNYNGVELTFQKRYANRWSMNASYAFNNAVDHWDSLNAVEDPTCCGIQTAGSMENTPFCGTSMQFAQEAGGSGIFLTITIVLFIAPIVAMILHATGKVMHGKRPATNAPSS